MIGDMSDYKTIVNFVVSLTSMLEKKKKKVHNHLIKGLIATYSLVV